VAGKVKCKHCCCISCLYNDFVYGAEVTRLDHCGDFIIDPEYKDLNPKFKTCLKDWFKSQNKN